MKIIESSGVYSVKTDDEIIVHNVLPVGCYETCFSDRLGPYLKLREPLVVTEKVYGEHTSKVDKAFSAYDSQKRSLGVILSGDKGIGKSLFTKILAQEAARRDMPVITVRNPIPGLVELIESITQECVVIFDEFEKNFHDDNDDEADNYESAQIPLLSMFDGLNSTKKFFLVTCNNVSGLNPFMLNRPGRFHYHFKLKNPTPDEVKAYLEDRLDSKFADAIQRVYNLSYVSKMTYDCLRAIAVEIGRGYPVEEIFSDLNITLSRDVFINFTVAFKTYGEYEGSERIYIGTPSKDVVCLRRHHEKGYDEARVEIRPSDIKIENGVFSIDKSKIEARVKVNGEWVDVPAAEIKSIELIADVMGEKGQELFF